MSRSVSPSPFLRVPCRGLLVMVLCLPGSTSPVGGQDSPLAGRLDPVTQEAVLATVDSARARGLPAEPLVAKALEGAAKGAPADRIVSAVRALAADLGSARAALGASVDAADVVAGAGVLRAGASPALLHDLRSARGPLGVGVPLAVLTSLMGRGVPVDTAAAVVLDLARRGAPDAHYAGLERRVLQDIGAGVPPGAAVAARAPAGAPVPPVAPSAGLARPAPPAGSQGPVRRP